MTNDANSAYSDGNISKLYSMLVKRVADQWGVHIDQDWEQRVLVGEHDVPTPLEFQQADNRLYSTMDYSGSFGTHLREAIDIVKDIIAEPVAAAREEAKRPRPKDQLAKSVLNVTGADAYMDSLESQIKAKDKRVKELEAGFSIQERGRVRRDVRIYELKALLKETLHDFLYSCQKGVMVRCQCEACVKERVRAALAKESK